MTDEEKRERIKEQLEAEYYLKHRRLEKIARKSFILSKQKVEEDSEISNLLSQVKKKNKLERLLNESPYFSPFYFKYFIHKNPELLTFLLIQLSTNIVVHPIDTIKVRIQSRNVVGDISGFIKNRAEKKSVYMGLSYSYYLVGLQAFAYTAVSKLTLVDFLKYDPYKRDYFNLLITDVVTAPLKYYLDTRKMLLQMGNEKVISSTVFRNYKKAFLPLYLRDLSFKSFFYLANTTGQDVDKPRNPFYSYVLATLVTSIMTAPFDVICSKMATQKDLYYKGFRDALSKINIEEGSGKFLSGVSMRIIIMSLLGAANLFFYNDTLKFVKEVYTLDNVIN